MSRETCEYLIVLLQDVLKGKPFSIQDRTKDSPKIKAWGMGVLRGYYFYEYCVEKFLKKNSPERLKLFLVIAFFRVDSYKGAGPSLINAIVDEAKQLNFPASLVNAVLRRYTLEKEKLKVKTRGVASIQYNMRESLLSVLKEDHDNWREIIRYMQKPSLVCLFVQQRKVSLDVFIHKLGNIKHERIKYGVVLLEPVSIQQLPGYREGWFSVLSESNQTLLSILPNIPVKNILDACAAPGGKSLLLRTKYGDAASITAVDINKERLERLKENNERLDLSLNIKLTSEHDPSCLYDLVWADVPCSATGVIAKHPEIAIQDRKDQENTNTQQKLLFDLWQKVTPGGTLIYSTCSILHAENDTLIQAFLAHNPDASIISHPKDSQITSTLGAYATSNYSHDIIYYAVLIKAT